MSKAFASASDLTLVRRLIYLESVYDSKLFQIMSFRAIVILYVHQLFTFFPSFTPSITSAKYSYLSTPLNGGISCSKLVKDVFSFVVVLESWMRNSQLSMEAPTITSETRHKSTTGLLTCESTSWVSSWWKPVPVCSTSLDKVVIHACVFISFLAWIHSWADMFGAVG